MTSGKAGGLSREPLKAALCRTFGARHLRLPLTPGLTAGAIFFRLFEAENSPNGDRLPASLTGGCKLGLPFTRLKRKTRREAPAGNSPGREAGDLS